MKMNSMTIQTAPTCDRPETADDVALKAHIRGLIDRWGDRLVILAHHYQRKEIVPFGNFIGDSYYLSKMAAQQEKAEHIVFCGVHFMAESARILCRPEQHVYLPNLRAGCPMADMADDAQVDDAWEWLGQHIDTTKIIPVSYMNAARKSSSSPMNISAPTPPTVWESRVTNACSSIRCIRPLIRSRSSRHASSCGRASATATPPSLWAMSSRHAATTPASRSSCIRNAKRTWSIAPMRSARRRLSPSMSLLSLRVRSSPSAPKSI
ncbi:MAG: quinolinate synthase NadA [candidate division Zixibacteria bacterium]|nr:quinolinate synthase NadA [candidate division Zixibacteria bacterium]